MQDLSEDAGEIIDAEIVEESEPPRERARRSRRDVPPVSRNAPDSGSAPPRGAKAGPPSLDEWTGFFSRVVLRLTTEWYISYAFRGINEDDLTERELDRMALTDDERTMISVPFAELSHKSKFMRKHGRTIVASGDALNAVAVMGAWMSRVNRIAARHRPRQPKSRTVINGSSGQSEAEAGPAQEGATGGKFPPWFSGPVIPGSS